MVGKDAVDAIIVGAGASGAAHRLATGQRRMAGGVPGAGRLGHRTAPASESLDWELARQRARHPNPNMRRGPADYPIDDSTPRSVLSSTTASAGR